MGKSRSRRVTDDEIIASYARFSSAYKAARALGIGTATIYRVLAIRGVKPVGLALYRASARRFTSEQNAEIRGFYEAGVLAEDLVRHFGGTQYSIKKAVQRAGGELRPNPVPLLSGGELEEIRRMYVDEKLSAFRISVAIGRSQSFVSRALHGNGIPTRARSVGPAHGMWNGGTWLKADGYRMMAVTADDALASMRDRAGYVLEHRLVMARLLGRPLTRRETVHHIDGDIANNSIENLQLRQGRHGKGAAFRCADCGSHNVRATPLADRKQKD
jgi:uncharacterized protein (DUF1330 family)